MRGLRVSAIFLGVIVAAATLLQSGAMPQAIKAQQTSSEDTGIVQHLNAAITWYRQLTSANESAGQPSDAYYLENARSLAKQAVQLAFQSAEIEAAIQATEKSGEAFGAGPGPSAQASGERQNIAKAAASAATLIGQIQAQIEALNGQIAKASGKRLRDLSSKRESLQEQLDFNQALEDALQKMMTFMRGTAAASGGLEKEIDNLKESVPDVFAKAPEKTAASARSGSPPTAPEGLGLTSQVSLLFSRIAGLREVDQLMDGAAGVADMARQLQSPLWAKLRSTVQQGRDLANQPTPQDPASMEASRQKMISLTTQFKQIANATLPLTQEIILLEDIQANLRQWQSSVHSGYIHALKGFLIRLASILLAVGIVLGLSEVWLKVTFRYVHDAHKRHQLLIVRRIVTAILMAIILVLGFVSEFASLATFAGFLTAGIAVALQTVILSVAAYFVLIGRNGVKVGDRITVSGVTGDVIDVGLVQFSLMELGGKGSDLHPTGRVVEVSNSVLFQGALFKQIPGTAYTWHEVVVKLERGGDYSLAEGKLLDAVNSVYSQYRESLEQQHQGLDDLVGVPVSAPRPQSRLQLVENGLALVVRYPVVFYRESEIDDQMAKKVLEIIDSLPELKATVGAPTIRSAN
jgi:small-conductance mechanosensitive channel